MKASFYFGLNLVVRGISLAIVLTAFLCHDCNQAIPCFVVGYSYTAEYLRSVDIYPLFVALLWSNQLSSQGCIHFSCLYYSHSFVGHLHHEFFLRVSFNGK
jgi:hypothetical protein